MKWWKRVWREGWKTETERVMRERGGKRESCWNSGSILYCWVLKWWWQLSPWVSSSRLDNRMGFSRGLEVAPTPVAPAKQTPRAASSHFITLHQIKSNKLITNDCGHASSKYRINIIDLILSMLSEKRINAGARITALFSRATATIGWIKRSHEVHSGKVNSTDGSSIHTETLG